MAADTVVDTGVSKPMTGLGRLSRFSLVGAAGFVCDAGVLTLLVQFMGWSPYSARAVSFLLAATTTWALNRRFAFHDRAADSDSTSRQYLQYLGAQTMGSAANMAVFALVVWRWPQLQAVVVVPLAIGAVAGVILNYLLLDRWVFRHRRKPVLPG